MTHGSTAQMANWQMRFLPKSKLLRFLAINALIGGLVGLVVTMALVATDAHRLGTLIFASENPVLPIAMLAFGFVITLGSTAMGWAIMSLPYDDDPKSGHRQERAPEIEPMAGHLRPVPVTVPVTTR